MARTLVLLSVAVVLLSSFQFDAGSGQNFEPGVEDKDYLDGIQRRLNEEVTEAHKVLVNRTKLLQQVTKTFIESKIKENLFKAVRVRVEEELEEMSSSNRTATLKRRRQSRQDDDDDETTTPIPRRRPGLLPQLANAVTTLFGPGVNVTSYVKEATSFLPPDLSQRFVDAASLIDPNNFIPTSTLPPLIINGQVIPNRFYNNQTGLIYPTNNGALVSGQLSPSVGLNSGLGGVQQGFVQQAGLYQQNNNNGQGLQSQQQQQYNPNIIAGIPQSQIQGPQTSNVGDIPPAAALHNQLAQSPQGNYPQEGNNNFLQTRQQQLLHQQQQQSLAGGGHLGQNNNQGLQQQQQQQYLQQQQQQFNQQFGGQQQLNSQFGQQNQQLNNQQQLEQQYQQQQQQQNNYGNNNGLLQQTSNNGQFQQQQQQEQQYQFQQQYQPGLLQSNNNLNQNNNNNNNNALNTSPFVKARTTPVPHNSNEDNDNSSGEDEIGSHSGPPKNPLDLGDIDDSSSEIFDDLAEEEAPFFYDDLSPDNSSSSTSPSPSADKMGKQDKPEKKPASSSSTPAPAGGVLNEYPVINYAFKLFNRLTATNTEIPTTTEYTNVTRQSIDSLEEEEMAATSPSTPTVSRLVQGGVALYEGAREAYQLLTHLNKFLDRVNDRFETAGYGAEEVGVPADDVNL